MIQDVSASSRRSSGSSRGRQLYALQNLQIGKCDVTPGIAKAILRTIDGYGSQCWAAQPTIAKDSQFSKSTVERAMKWLHAAGYVRRQKRPGDTDIYQLNWDHPALNQTDGDTAEAPTPVTVTTPGGDSTLVTETTHPRHSDDAPSSQRRTTPVTVTNNTSIDTKSKYKKKPDSGGRAKPSLDSVKEFWNANSLNGNAEAYYDHYEANGWIQGKNKPIKNWQAAARGWSRRQPEFEPAKAEKADWTKELRPAPEPLYPRPKPIPGWYENAKTQGRKNEIE